MTSLIGCAISGKFAWGAFDCGLVFGIGVVLNWRLYNNPVMHPCTRAPLPRVRALTSPIKSLPSARTMAGCRSCSFLPSGQGVGAGGFDLIMMWEDTRACIRTTCASYNPKFSNLHLAYMRGSLACVLLRLHFSSCACGAAVQVSTNVCPNSQLVADAFIGSLRCLMRCLGRLTSYSGLAT